MAIDFETWVRHHADAAIAYRKANAPGEPLLPMCAIRQGDQESLYGLGMPPDAIGEIVGIIAREKTPDYLCLVIDSYVVAIKQGDPVPTGPVKNMPGRSDAMVIVGRDLTTGQSITASVRYFRHENEWVFDEPLLADHAETRFFEALP